MLDMCQLTNRLTEHKYYGTYQQLAETIKKYSSAPMLDVQRFWELVLFSWMTGNSDMHCKNFSLIDTGNGEYVLSPAYDLLAVLLADPADTEEMAMSFSVGGRKSGFDRNTFMTAFVESGIPVSRSEQYFHDSIRRKRYSCFQIREDDRTNENTSPQMERTHQPVISAREDEG